MTKDDGERRLKLIVALQPFLTFDFPAENGWSDTDELTLTTESGWVLMRLHVCEFRALAALLPTPSENTDGR